MRIYRYFLFVVPVVGLVVLTGALRNPFGSTDHDIPSMPEELAALIDAPANPEAVKVVQSVIANLADPAHPWLQTDVRMRCLLPDLRFSAEGTFLRASGQRFRLEVRTRMEDPEATSASETTVLALSDGNDLWQATRTSQQGYRDVQRLRLGEIYRGTNSLPHLASVRQRLLAGPAVRGPEQMVRYLQGILAWVHVEQRGNERDVIGVLVPSLKAALVPKGKPWPAALPKLCRLTLQGPEGWPARLQWWGPASENGPDGLLTELEFRRPIRDEVIPEEQCAHLFRFHPGDAVVTDTTPTVRAQVDPRP